MKPTASKLKAMLMTSALLTAVGTMPLNFSFAADGADVLSNRQVTAKSKAIIAEATNGVISLRINDPGWEAGAVLKPATGDSSWDLTGWDVLAVDIENVSPDKQMRLLMQVVASEPAADQASLAPALPGMNDRAPREAVKSAGVGIGLNPGEKRTMRLKLPHRWKYAHPENTPGIRTIDTSKVVRVEFFVQWPYERTTPELVDCKISNLRGEGTLTPGQPDVPTEKYIPFIDAYGQFIHRDWPAKVKSDEDYRKQHTAELAELDKAKRPDQWNRFGGWANGPKLSATGNFRVEKVDGKWYFVDPDGNLFFSHGVDVLSNYNDPLRVMPGRENWFETLPAGATTFQPTEHALRTKYGSEDYRPAYYSTLARRLEAWGFNSIGNWSRAELIEQGKQPYTLQLTDFNSRMPRIEGSKKKFYDVFDERYISAMKTLLKDQAAKSPVVQQSLTDPMCIGYFIDNELDFGNRGRMTLVDDILKAPAAQASKIEFSNDLKKQYDSIDKLNTAWNTTHTDWAAFLESTDVPTSDAYRQDAQTFFLKCVDQYFRLCRDAVKTDAPHRLYLGTRFVGTDAVRKPLYEASKKYCDVLTVNIYAHSIANFPVADFPDMPVLIGEFHFGVIDRGMFNPSLCNVGVDQNDRAIAYTRFMQGALVHPNIVGTHWFQYRDQPLTGRGDGEAYQIGFVDTNDTPYTELCQAALEVGKHMYTYRQTGKLTNAMDGK